ncbi:MAG: cytochrome c biogenesis protein ResB, partial [Chloroflexota bacterium]|nr:cytochrome c biogenesis protein ResB [Chloroflexota bacterium]
LESQRGRYGVFTDALYRLGLFDIFHARYFAISLGLLVVSVSLCTANRFPPIWRTIRRPQRRVPDTYFERAHHRVAFGAPADAAALEAVLRRRHYRVERVREGEATYLFADRFAWAQLGTFVSHLALILFLAGALVSKFTAFSAPLFAAEGTSAPVFAVKNPDQMQVRVVDTVGQFDEEGQPLDYRTEMAIYQGGQEVKRCTTTVNGPCGYGGYRFHQAAYFGFGAEVQVRDIASGNVVYKEVLALSDTMPAPRVVIRDGDGQPLLDETLVLSDFIESAYGTTVAIPGSERLVWIGAKPAAAGGAWQLVVFEPGDSAESVRLILGVGEKARSGGLEFEFASLGGLPAIFEPQFPLPAASQGEGSQGTVLLQMSNVVYGTNDASSGRRVSVVAAAGPPTLSIIGVSPYVVNLEPGRSAVVGGYEYTFLGQREFAGIQVKRDRSDNLIWVGTALLLVGLGVTFYVPRRRLWVKITPDRTYLAGIAGHLANLRREMGKLGAEAGLPAPEAHQSKADGGQAGSPDALEGQHDGSS